MKRKNLLLILCMLAFTLTVTPQEIIDVAPGTGTLNAAIAANGGSKVYRLQNGYNGYYVLSEVINNTGFELTIIGGGTPDAGDPKPDMPPTLQTSGTGGGAFSLMFHVFANLTLRGLYLMNATSDGVVNYHYLIQVDGNNCRVEIDNCVLDPASNNVYVTGRNASVFMTNTLVNKATDQTTSVNGPVQFLFMNNEYGLDTLFLENNTMIGLSTAIFHDAFSPVKTDFIWINHNTFIHHKAQMKWMSGSEKFFFTNNLLYDTHAVPTRPIAPDAVNHWTGYPAGSVTELLMGYPRDSIKDNNVWIEWGFDKETNFVANNIKFENPQFHRNLDSLYAWTTAVGAANTYFIAPLVWTPDAPAIGIDLAYALANSPLAKVYNNPEYPNWKAANNNYDINPTFTDHRIDSLSAIFAEWTLPAIKMIISMLIILAVLLLQV
jgi:hypothetical protein